MTDFKNIAVLIDADNTELKRLEAVLNQIAAYGHISVKRAYGNWKKETLKDWPEEIKRLAISPVQQFDYVKGKNATDIALVIDAMELLYKDKYDCFVLISSDSDFTPLSIKIKESCVFVIGVGRTTTPESFRKVCDDFILLENMIPSSPPAPLTEAAARTADLSLQCRDTIPAPTADDRFNNESNDQKLFSIMREVWEQNRAHDTDYILLSKVGELLHSRKIPVKSFGYKKLEEAIDRRPDLYEKQKAGNVISFRLVTQSHVTQKPVSSGILGSDIHIIHGFLRQAWEEYQDADGFALLSMAGSYLKRVKPDFDAKTYKHKQLLDLLNAYPELYVTKGNQQYKCL